MREQIRVRVDNRTAMVFRPYPYEALLPYWSYAVPDKAYRFMIRRFPGWDGRIKMFKYNRLPAGLFWSTYRDIERDLNIEFDINTDRLKFPPCKTAGVLVSKGKYAFQNAVLRKMLMASQFGGGLILNATGSGKTWIASMFASAIEGPLVFIVDEVHLLEQARRDMQSALGEKIGYVGNQIFDPQRITIATIQTLHKHRKDPRFLPWIESIDAVIIDEIHVQMNRRNFKVVDTIRPYCVFGLTATLEMQRKPIRIRAWSLAGPVIYRYPIARGMEEGVLSKGLCVQVKYPNHMDSEEIAHGNYLQQYDEHIIYNHERNWLIASLANVARQRKYYVIIHVQRIDHIKNLSKLLEGIPHRLVYGKKEVTDRMRYVRQLEKGKVRIIIANQVFKKGIDVKRVDIMIDAAAGRSPNDAVQKFGRGVRVHKEKSGLIYFDICDLDEQKVTFKKRVFRNGRWGPVLVSRRNRFHTAGKKRRRALKAAGIPVKQLEWDPSVKAAELLNRAERLLKKELDRDKTSKN